MSLATDTTHRISVDFGDSHYRYMTACGLFQSTSIGLTPYNFGITCPICITRLHPILVKRQKEQWDETALELAANTNRALDPKQYVKVYKHYETCHCR